MKARIPRQRLYALLFMLGASILLFRTIRMMIVEQAFEILVPWVIALLLAEFLLDLGWFIASVNWFISNKRERARLPLRLCAAAVILHAFRVLIYVLGRTGPWLNFDVRPEYHESYTFEWFWVYFAAILSILGLIGVVVIWQLIRYRSKRERKAN